MLNDNAKAVISKLQYIIDRFVKVRFYSTPKRIANEPHDVEKQSDNKYIAFFSEIISDREIHTINVYKESTAEQPVPDFPEYELVDRQPLKKNECYVDRENNLIYFHSSQIGAKISVTYYSIGVGMLSSALIYTHFDSNNKIIETLFDLTRRCQEELDRISAVTDAEQLKVELKSYIESLLELMRLYPNPKEIIKELEEAVRNGNDLMAVLGDVVAEGQRLMEEIKTASNKSVTIQPSYWTSAGGGRYKYEYTHNLNTFNLVITTTQIVSGIETSTVLDYEKPTSNKIVFYTSDNTITAKAVISASYYPGFLSDIGTISADSVVDGTEKVSMTVEERNGLIKAQNDIKRIDSDLSEAKQDIVDLNEDLDGLNGEFVTHKNDYNTFKTQTNNTLASHSNILTNHSSQLEHIVQGDGNKKLKVLAGVIRNEGDGWKYIINETHDKLNMIDSIETLDDKIKLNFSFNAKKILGFVTNVDETFQADGIQCGASVGTNYAELKLSKFTKSVDAYIIKSNGNFILDDQYTINVNSIAWDDINKKLTISHIPTNGGKSITINNRNYFSEPKLSSPFSDDTITLTFVGTGGYINSYIYYNGNSWVSEEKGVVNGNQLNKIYSISYSTDTGYLTINHSKCLGYSVMAQPKDTSYGCSVVSLTDTTTTLKFYNAVGETLKVADTSMRLFFTRNINNTGEKFTPLDGEVEFFISRPPLFLNNINPKTLVSPYGNIWFMGIFEIE